MHIGRGITPQWRQARNKADYGIAGVKNGAIQSQRLFLIITNRQRPSDNLIDWPKGRQSIDPPRRQPSDPLPSTQLRERDQFCHPSLAIARENRGGNARFLSEETRNCPRAGRDDVARNGCDPVAPTCPADRRTQTHPCGRSRRSGYKNVCRSASRLPCSGRFAA